MIIPVNGHLVIEPVAHETFISSQRETFEEIGVVIAKPPTDEYVGSGVYNDFKSVNIGDKVYFDAWLAAKYPKGEDGFYWLVKWEDIRAIEHAEVSEQ